MSICTSCLAEIKKDKMPKKSHKNSFKYANFPKTLIRKLKNTCKIKKGHISSLFKEDNDIFEREALKLNKLESFLLKRVIPFIRIAHCPRGSSFKVLGDLILISADVSNSLDKILPLEQSLLPVSFKRKLAYHGSYIEEIVDKNKVKHYFEWLKSNNHLYSDFQFDEVLLDRFESDSLKTSEEFQAKTKSRHEKPEEQKENEEVEVSLDEEEYH